MTQEFGQGMRLAALTTLSQSMASIKDHGWLGRTHLQKAAYFLQEHLGIPFGYTFTIYQYGPYSSVLDSDVMSLLNSDVLKMSVDTGYPDYDIGSNADGFLTYFEKNAAAGEYSATFKRAAEVLGPRKTRELELLTTISFLKNHGLDGDELVIQLRRLKPHFTESAVKAGVLELGNVLAALSSK